MLVVSQLRKHHANVQLCITLGDAHEFLELYGIQARPTVGVDHIDTEFSRSNWVGPIGQEEVKGEGLTNTLEP